MKNSWISQSRPWRYHQVYVTRREAREAALGGYAAVFVTLRWQLLTYVEKGCET